MHLITLAGKDYSLHFSVNSLCCLEEKMEKGLDSLMKTQLSCLRGLLWCGLMEKQEGITLDQAGSILEAHLKQGGSLSQVSNQLAQSLEDAGFFPYPGRKTPAAGCESGI